MDVMRGVSHGFKALKRQDFSSFSTTCAARRDEQSSRNM